jgi:hypothetical protein
VVLEEYEHAKAIAVYGSCWFREWHAFYMTVLTLTALPFHAMACAMVVSM